MPNHTDNLLSIVGENNIKDILYPYMTYTQPEQSRELGMMMMDTDESEREYFLDFDKIVPMPKEIKEASELADFELLMRLDEKGRKEHEKKVKRLERICVKKYGSKGWYDWSLKNWGTKWNSYSNHFSKKGDVLFFQTAWSPPAEVLMVLAQKLKKILRVTYKDEGYGFFGTFHFYPDGKVDDECYQEHKNVPEELCRELCINTYEEDLKEQEEQDQLANA